MIITRDSAVGRGCGIVRGVGGARGEKEGHSIEMERDLYGNDVLVKYTKRIKRRGRKRRWGRKRVSERDREGGGEK